jgi:hypothetical protein
MSIKIKIGTPVQSAESKIIAKLDLKIRKSINGDAYISDHKDIDIIVSREKLKILAIAKELMSSQVYGAQDRLFVFMTRCGIIDPDSVQAGSVYGSMEGELLTSTELNSFNIAIMNLSKWIEEERPYFEFADKFEEMETNRFTDPDEEESTELGEVPQAETKGALRPGYNYGPYWQSYSY